MKNTKTVLFRLASIVVITFLMTCEKQIFDNPHDAEAELNPNEWAPSNLQVQAINDSKIKLTWAQEEERISGFRIERKTNSVDFIYISEVSDDITEFTDTGLNYGTDYTYRVKAFTDNNESGYDTSNTTNTSFPSPSNLTAAPIDDQSIQLTWSDNSNFESGYRIERSYDGTNFSQVAEVGVSVNEFTDTGLIYGSDYTYRVKAFTGENESGYTTSNTTNTYFPSPTNLTATVISDSEIQLTWNDNCSFESGYRIERSDDGANFNQISEMVENVTDFINTDVALETNYTYRVIAFTESNESGSTNSASVYLYYDCEGLFLGTAIEDCYGDCNGNAFMNVCDICVGGNTGIEEDHCEPLTDYNGNEYQTVIIGEQAWMAENLKVINYRNGVPIPHLIGDNDWSSTSSGAYCEYENDSSYVNTYGRLYNWYVVDDNQNIAPEGWHVPTDDEWQILVDYLGGQSVAGGKLKEVGTEHWNNPNTGATNESSFTALPGGYRDNTNGSFYFLGETGFFWSSTESNSSDAWYWVLNNQESGVSRSDYFKELGFSVRCVKD